MYQLITGIAFLTLLVMDICLGKANLDACISGVCWHDPNYPYEEIKSSYHSSPHFKEAFGKLEHSSGRYEHVPSNSLCKLRYSVKVQPLSIMDDNIKRFVLNTSKYSNKFTLNICDGEQSESKCTRQTCDPLNYRFTCEQKETRVQIMTYNLDNKIFEVHNLTYPSACSCQAILSQSMDLCTNYE